MDSKTITPPGFWKPAVEITDLAGISKLMDTRGLDDGTVVWLESLDGQATMMAKRPGDAIQKIVTGKKVHGPIGYGGGEFCVFGDDIYFSADDTLYKVSKHGGELTQVARKLGDIASVTVSPNGSNAIVIHSSDRRDSILITPLNKFAWPVELVSGADFYMQPVWHPNGDQIAWIEWDHPQMPWDGTRLMIADFNDSKLINPRLIAGGVDTPVFQPEFSPDGRYLSYIALSGEYDTLYLLDLQTGSTKELVKDKILMQPAWLQGMRTYAWDADGITYIETQLGKRTLWHASLSGDPRQISMGPYSWLEQISISPKTGAIVLIASSAKIPARVVKVTNGALETIHRSAPENIPDGFLSEPVAINWPAPDGTITHALFYEPSHPNCVNDSLPPLILNVHGGPTSSRNFTFNNEAIFFTSRGYAYAELNHRGSTGYGRSFMVKLRRNWGKVDVEDAVDCAKSIAELGLADRNRVAIMGGSAGGFTTIAALTRHPGFFKLGINLYGVSNLFDFLIETHKFEERYNESLVGSYPKDIERIKELSPSEHLDQIRDPMLVFQGEIDPVVPQAHSDLVVEALRKNGVPYDYVVYPGEGHGFKKIANIVNMYARIDKALKEWLLL